MPDPAANPDLLRSLGQLVRGLAVLFWGLPVALVVCVQTAQADYLRMLGVVPPLVVTGALLYGLRLLGRFHREERVWSEALERARFFALLNLGLSPFLFWWSRIPSNGFYTYMAQLMALSGVLFLLSLNPVLRRLTAMLPDETLRHETHAFTKLNAALLGLSLGLLLAYFAIFHLKWHPPTSAKWAMLFERGAQWFILFTVLLPTATTMALLWKTKQAIFDSVFGGNQ